MNGLLKCYFAFASRMHACLLQAGIDTVNALQKNTKQKYLLTFDNCRSIFVSEDIRTLYLLQIKHPLP